MHDRVHTFLNTEKNICSSKTTSDGSQNNCVLMILERWNRKAVEPHRFVSVVSVHVCVFLRVFMYTCESQEETLGVTLSGTPPSFLRLVLSLTITGWARLACQEAPESISPVPGLLVHTMVPRFYEDSADLNSGSQTCAVDT